MLVDTEGILGTHSLRATLNARRPEASSKREDGSGVAVGEVTLTRFE
jgi:hypothetical protein